MTTIDALLETEATLQSVATQAHRKEPLYADGDFCPIHFLILRGVGLTTFAHRSAALRVQPKGSQVKVISPFLNLIETCYLG